MSTSKYEFGTSILTSKTPLEAAAILPHTLNSSQYLVQTKLINWFQNYAQEQQRHNFELGKLLNEGAGILGFTPPQPGASHAKPPTNSNGPERSFTANDLGSFNKVWNTFLRLIELEVHSNEQFFKNIKLETLAPLRNFIGNDVRYSELTLNSQELQEAAHDLKQEKSNAEYQWNVKAPQIFDNLENFEKVKSQLLFDIVLNYFNATTTKNGKLVRNSENSVNYLLGTYNLDDEMKLYLDYLLKSDFTLELSQKPSQPVVPVPSVPPHLGAAHKRLSTFGHRNVSAQSNHSDLASVNSSTSSSKKPSKLKSKVGSIFGRKKKDKKVGKLDDTIPENESVASTVIHSNRSVDTFSQQQLQQLQQYHQQHTQQPIIPPPKTNSAQSSPRRDQELPPPPPQQQQVQQVQHQHSITEDRTPSSDVFPPSSGSPFGSGAPNASASAPVSTSAPVPPPVHDFVPLTPVPKQNGQDYNSPNVVKYEDSSSDEDAKPFKPIDPGRPIVTDQLTSESNGKFSFDEGDDERPISSPSNPQRNIFDDSLPAPNLLQNSSELPSFPVAATAAGVSEDVTATPVDSGSTIAAGTAGTTGSIPSSASTNGTVGAIGSTGGSAPPPPPPSRKVHARDDHSIISETSSQTSRRKDIKSQYFHNLPQARDSIIVPPRKLTSQDTGNSLIRQLNNSSGDIFAHSEESNQIGLNASIAEVINASFKDDKVVRQQIIGEIAFNYKPDPSTSLNLEKLPITITPSSFDKVILNNQFVTKTGELNDRFLVDPQAIISRTLGVLSMSSLSKQCLC